MSERIKIICYTLWIAHPALQTAVATVMLRRSQHRRFKLFFTYIVAQIPIFALVFPAYWYNYSGYFYLYWITDAISMALGFALIYEAFDDVFQPFESLRDLGIRGTYVYSVDATFR